jgi:creatinine amidohydrolase
VERRLNFLNHLELKGLVPDKTDIVLVPVGTIEAHGIIPLGTDVIIPEAMAGRIAEDINALIAPTVPYGITRSLVGYPGTVSIRPDVFQAYMADLFESLVRTGFRKVVVINGHGGQRDELKDALFAVSKATGAKTLFIDWWYETDEIRQRTLEREGGHAAADETACIMAVDPSLVKPDLFDDEMVAMHSRAYAAYPFPGPIITYTEGDTSLNLDEDACRAYFDQVVAKVTATIKTVLSKWNRM